MFLQKRRSKTMILALLRRFFSDMVNGLHRCLFGMAH